MKTKKGKTKLKLVALSERIHERVRLLAFQRHMSLKNVVEEALREYYKWGKEDR